MRTASVGFLFGIEPLQNGIGVQTLSLLPDKEGAQSTACKAEWAV